MGSFISSLSTFADRGIRVGHMRLNGAHANFSVSARAMETRRRNPSVAGAPFDRLAKATAIHGAALEKKVPGPSVISALVHATVTRARLLEAGLEPLPADSLSESLGCSRGARY
jgi:hypothetical protein